MIRVKIINVIECEDIEIRTMVVYDSDIPEYIFDIYATVPNTYQMMMFERGEWKNEAIS